MSGIFRFDDKPLRTETINGEPWFALIDVGRALGLSDGACRMFIKSPSCDRACVNQIDAKCGNRIRKVNFINERNLYALVARSDKKEALRFMDWVYSEVLPTIRKTGSFQAPVEATPKVVPAELVQWMQSMTSTVNAVLSVVAELTSTVQAMQALPKPSQQIIHALPAAVSVDPFADVTRRSDIPPLIRKVMRAGGYSAPEVYGMAYSILEESYGLEGFRAEARARRMKPLSWLEGTSNLDTLSQVLRRLALEASENLAA